MYTIVIEIVVEIVIDFLSPILSQILTAFWIVNRRIVRHEYIKVEMPYEYSVLIFIALNHDWFETKIRQVRYLLMISMVF